MAKSVFHAFALLGLSLAVHSFDIDFSTPQQCGNVQISWTGSSAVQLSFPLLLHILPFTSTAITQPIYGWNASMTSGSVILPFHLASGTPFLLAVTDKAGQGAGPVSDLKTATDSHDASCLTAESTTPGHFQVFTTADPSSCPSITVAWDGTVRSSRPTILAFSPSKLPVNMDSPTDPPPLDRIATSNGTFTSLTQVVVLFRDQDSSPTGQTSQFLTVGGTDRDACSSSSTSATTVGMWATSTPSPTMSANQSSHYDRNGAGRVFGGVAAGIVGLAIVLFVIFAYREGRFRKMRGLIPHSRIFSDRTSAIPSGRRDSFNILPSFPDPPPAPDTTKPGSHKGEPPQEPEPSNTPTRTSPVTRRRSWVARPALPARTDPISFLYLSYSDDQSLSSSGQNEPRPDSPTLPDSRSLRQASAPATPTTPKMRPPRSANREQFVMSNFASKIQISDEIRTPSRQTSRTKKAH